MKALGSIIFGTSTVRTEEYILFVKTAKENGSSTEEAMLDIKAIDDLLSLQKISSIINSKRYTKTGRIRKDSHFLDVVEKRINQLVDEQDELNEK